VENFRFCYWKLWFTFCQVILVLVSCAGSSSPVKTEKIEAKKPATNSLKTPSPASQVSKKVYDIAEKITVRVWSNSPIGSGTIIKRHGRIYTILTAAHILRAGDSPYTIQTPDGQRYSAEIVLKPNLKQKDVVLLQFHSSQSAYAIASIGTVGKSNIKQKVYAAGFPINNRSQLNSQLNSKLLLREGEIVLLLEKPLKDGYRLAYTSSVDSGMSGGSVLNERGEVIGINGLRDDPIWYVPMKYEDGTEPNSHTQNLIANSSLAIPIKDILIIFD
jgi:S1-C subfamily serine protease